MNSRMFLLLLILISILIPVLPFTGNIHVESAHYPVTAGTELRSPKSIYVNGNLTINSENENIAKCYKLVFEDYKQSFLQIKANVSFESEMIITKNSNLTIDTASGGYHIGICDSDFFFNGSMNFEGDAIHISDSRIGNNCSHIRMKYTNDTMLFRNSTFRNVNNSKTVYRETGYFLQNSQPISAAGNFSYNYIRNSDYKYPVSEIKFEGNFSYNGSGISLGISSTFDDNLISDHVNITKGIGTFNSTVFLQHPIYLRNLCSSGQSIHISIPYGSNLTIWKSSICFISNSTLNITGFSTNYIVLNDTHLVSLNSSFSGNSFPFTNSGFYDLKKEGFLLQNGSEFIMIGSRFSGSFLTCKSPVITLGNSSFYFLPILNVMYIMYNELQYYHPEGIYPAGISSYNLNLSSVIDKLACSPDNNNSIIVPAYEQEKDGFLNSIFSFAMFNQTQYFSIPPIEVFRNGYYTYTKTYHDVPFININSEDSFNNSYIVLNTSLNESLPGSVNLTLNTTIKGDNYTQSSRLGIEIRSMNDYSSTVYIPRKRSLHYDIIDIDSQVKYYNGIKNITEFSSEVFSVPPLYSVFILKSVNLSYGLNFSVRINNQVYHSTNGTIEIRSVNELLNVSIVNSGFMEPVKQNITAHLGLTDVKYQLMTGDIIFRGTISRNTTIEIGNRKYEYSEGLSILLAYGNHTIILNDSGRVTDLKIFLHTNSTTFYLYQISSKRPVDWNAEFLPILVSSIAVASIYNFSRKKVKRICPVCMREITFDRKHSHR